MQKEISKPYKAMSDQGDYTALRDLLESWNLLELWPHFQDEGINIAELQLMKLHHVTELLQHYKMGVRIRFEHHFEKWRRDLNKPLRDAAATHIHYGTVINQPLPKQQQQQDKEQLHKATNADNTQRCVDSPDNLASLLQPEVVLLQSPRQDLLKEMPKLTPQPRLSANSEERPTSQSAKPPQPPPAPAPPTASSSSPPQYRAVDTPLPSLSLLYEGVEKPPLTLLHILQTSGVKGNSLLEYYQKHQQLTNAHRTLLIHLIVNYFENNDYHLSLNVSHNLERQILKLFPTEKLSSYRTEKRGKIYVKFCNMKRYKRDRTGLKRKWDGGFQSTNDFAKDADVVDANDEEDDFMMGFDWADNQPPIEVQVKTENDDSL